MNHDGIKDMNFTLPNGIECVVRNVPYYDFNGEAEESVDLSTVSLLSMIRDLMYSGDIPCDIDYEKVKDLE